MQNKEKRLERAKLFQPFDALQGFHAYLRQKEEVFVQRKDLMEDAYAILQEKLNQLQQNDMIEVTYYKDNTYVKKQGMFVKLDPIYQRIQIVKQWIYVKDIIEIEWIQHKRNI